MCVCVCVCAWVCVCVCVCAVSVAHTPSNDWPLCLHCLPQDLIKASSPVAEKHARACSGVWSSRSLLVVVYDWIIHAHRHTHTHNFTHRQISDKQAKKTDDDSVKTADL